MPLTKKQSAAMAENIVNNLAAFTVNREDKMDLSVEQHVKLMREKRESRERRKAILNETFDTAAAMGYGNNNTKTGD